MGYSPWGYTQPDMTEHSILHCRCGQITHLNVINQSFLFSWPECMVQQCAVTQVRVTSILPRTSAQILRKEIILFPSGLSAIRARSDLFSSVQSLSCVQLFVTPWTAAHQISLSITNSRSSPKPMSIELVMPYNHLILCRPLLLPLSVFPSIRVFSSDSVLCISWPKYWSFSFKISPSNDTQN